MRGRWKSRGRKGRRGIHVEDERDMLVRHAVEEEFVSRRNMVYKIILMEGVIEEESM